MQKLLQSKLSLIIADKFDLAVVVTSSSVYCEFETVQSKCMIRKQVKQLVQFAVSYLSRSCLIANITDVKIHASVNLLNKNCAMKIDL